MENITKFIRKIASWLGGISPDRLLHFIAGTLIASFFALVIPCTAKWCIVFVLAAGVSKEAIDLHRYNGWDNIDLIYTLVGGMVIQIFAWL